MSDEYKYGECDVCHDKTWLRNDVCINCGNSDVPEILTQMFGGKNGK